MKRLLGPIALAALILSGCTVSTSDPADMQPTTNAPAPKVEVEKDAQYDLPDDVIAAAVSGGYDCGEEIDQTSLDYFITECENGGFFTAYDSSADRDE